MPAKPKSTSSGCAVTTSARSIPVEVHRFHAMLRDAIAVPDSPFDARELVGLLADDDRRRAFAALVLGATTIDGGAGRHRARPCGRPARAVQRLVDAGLVVRGDDGTLHLLGEAFALAARAEAERAPRSAEHDDEPENVARVLRVFVRDGRLTSIPTVRPKRLVVLDWLAQRFEPGRHYPEATVNLMLAGGAPRHRGVAALPRRRRDPRARPRRVLAGGRHVRPGVARVGTVRGWHWSSSIATSVRT